MKPQAKTLAFGAIVFCFLALVALFFWPPQQVLLSLRALPGITQETLVAQGSLFRIEEPFLFNRSTGMGVFAVEILSTRNFEDETHLVIGGDAKSLECFTNEIRFVNSGPSRAAAAGSGAVDGVTGLFEGLWQLVRHPVNSVGGVGSGIKNASVYAWNAKASDMKDDAMRLAKAFYYDKASETAAAHHLDYFDLKTEHGKAAVESEVNAHLAGRGVMEVALLAIPFSEVKFAGEGAEIAKAARIEEAVNTAEKMAEVGKLPADAVEFAKAGRLFPQMVGKMTATLERMKSAEKTYRFKPSVATLGEAVSSDYKATFFAANPELRGRVVVHHAIPQQAITYYRGVVTEPQIHSLENLRGIPKALDATLHKSDIAKEWNEFYRLNPPSGMTKEKLLEKATEIDRKFGCDFTPKRL